MKDIEKKAIIGTLEGLKAYYKNNYDYVAGEFRKSSNADTKIMLHKEMDRFEYYCEAIQQSINNIKAMIDILPKEEEQEDENN